MSGARTQAGRVLISAADSPSIDAFSRWRVSNPATLFDSQQIFGDSALTWENNTVGGASVTNQLARASVLMSTGGTTSGDLAYRQTRTHFRYQPGKSQLVFLTFVMSAAVTNARQRIGAFDEQDGLYLEQSDDVYLCKRSSTSGAPVDTRVAQSAWNIDRLDGRGPSGVKLDLTKTQILVIDFQALYAGRVRFGFDIGGVVLYAHEFNHANDLDVVYMTNANLPMRAEVENTGTAGGTATLEQICTSVSSEGGFEDERGLPFSANTGATVVGVTTRVPILSVRAKLTGPNAVRNVGQIIPQIYDVIASDSSALVEIVRNGTLTGPVWANVNATYSIAEYDVSASAIAGGIVVSSFGVPAGGGGPFSAAGAARVNPFTKNPIVRTTLNNQQDVLSIVATSSSGTSNLIAAMDWKELY